MSKLRQIIQMYCNGRSKQSIARMQKTSRNTVKRHIKRFLCLKLSLQEIQGLSDQELEDLFRDDIPSLPQTKLQQLYKHFPEAEKQLRRRGMTIRKIWEEYYQLHPDGYRQTAFYNYFRHWKKRSHPSMHMNHKAGEKVFVDYAGEKLQVVDPVTGEIRNVELFAGILGASQLTYAEATESQKKEDFIGACENMLHYFGGSPLAIVPDNLKSAVTKSHRYEPWLNENFELFAQHYSMAVLPARVYKPKDKSLVEGAVKIIYNRIYTQLHGRVFLSLVELNKAVLELVEKHNNMLMQGRDYSRRSQFEELEKGALQPLASTRFEMREQSTVTVMKNGHVCLSVDKHYYSVPFAYVGKKVRLLYSSSSVEVYYRYEAIARHERLKGAHVYTTDPSHMATHHKIVAEWNPDYFLKRARELHEDIERYIQAVLLHKPHPEQAYKSCQGILSFGKRVGVERLRRACNRAFDYELYNYRIIESILQKGLDRYSDDESPEQSMPDHDNIRGQAYYS